LINDGEARIDVKDSKLGEAKVLFPWLSLYVTSFDTSILTKKRASSFLKKGGEQK